MKIELNNNREQGAEKEGWNIYFIMIDDKDELCVLLRFKHSGYEIAFNFDVKNNFPPHSDEDLDLKSVFQKKIVDWIDKHIELFN